MEKSEQQQFLEDLDISQKQEDVLETSLVETSEVDPEKGEKTQEEEGFKAKNRRERRLVTQNQRLREEAIATNARLQALDESKKLREGTEEAEYRKLAEGIFGNDTPEAREASERLSKALDGVKETAKQEALQEIESRQGSESKAVKQEEDKLDEILEAVEDEFDTDMSNPENRKGFLTLLEKLSPKDKDGNIIEYADPSTTYEIYESRKEKPSNRAKELASRSMVHSGASQESKLQDDATVRYLKENGII